MDPYRDDPEQHSLPTVDEIRQNAAILGGSSTTGRNTPHHKKKWIWIGMAGFVCVLTLLMGVSVGLRNKKERSSPTTTTTTTTGTPSDTPPPPTSTEYYKRYQDTLDTLAKVSALEDLTRTGAPQQQALNWIANEDLDPLQADHPQFIQRYALATLYFALDGPHWTKQCRWLGMGDECKWNDDTYMDHQNILGGAGCLDDTHSPGEVTWLMLPMNRLKGTLPSELGLLTKLNFVLLSGNDLRGELPSSLGALPELSYLDVGHNELTGTVGSWIGSMTSLNTLDLAMNRFTGSLPTELGACPNMLAMDMEHNDLWGQLPTELASMTKITNLRLGFNALTGNIPTNIGVWGKNLKYLRLSNNRLEGKIPVGLSECTRLTALYLDDNELVGNMAPQISFLTNLRKLFLERNQFDDSLTENFLREVKHLQYFDVSHNRLQGKFPLHLLDHTKMEVLDLNHNELGGGTDGFLPDEFPVSTSLKYLSIQGNFLEGTIPTSIGNLQALRHLDMSSNRLDGPMPSEIGTLTKLDYLFLADNDFAVQDGFPAWIQPLTKLRELSLKQTAIKGQIPTWMGDLTHLRLLDLDWNRITGQMPTELGKLTNMKYLLLNRNWINGTVPTEFLNMKKLELLLLDDNHFKDISVADTFCTGDDGKLMAPTYLKEFHADCFEDVSYYYLECPCCTQCCTKMDDFQNMTCYDDSFLANFDGDWETNYDRQKYYFSEDDTDLIFSSGHDDGLRRRRRSLGDLEYKHNKNDDNVWNLYLVIVVIVTKASVDD
eukprot:CAMPEP_0195289008 /NCGR_PEP_ID=MMETSP0707-20130614/5459_1 /TAXON_ID=33640 /ORGANISM="Asterionellopsis glacialis, Strain CCMP134" /LENGTH=771 /DNA_ID=CAMNT_0040348961 /DNA_START=231 /DNA_END=2544 /DNA_ORIENTATION=+